MEVQLAELNLCSHLGPPGAPVYQVGWLQFVALPLPPIHLPADTCPDTIWDSCPDTCPDQNLGSVAVQSLQDAITDSRLLGSKPVGWGILQQMATWESGNAHLELI